MLKNKLWLFQVPFVILFTGAYIVTDAGLKGELQNRFLFEKVYPKLQKVVTLFSDARFAIRGPIPPKDKVVIVEIDSGAIDQYGRWPWHRDVIAELIDRTLEAGAKVVGMDVVFSEPDTRVSPQMKQFLTERKLAEHIDSFETDHALKHIVAKRADRLVLGLASESLCRADQTPRSQFAPPAAAPVAAAEPAPAAEALSEYNCPVAPDGTEVAQMFPAGFERFALQGIEMPKHFDIWKTPIWTALTFLTNLEEYNNVAKHSAYFNVFPDQDHVIRRLPLVVMYNGRPYPSLSLEMARIGLDEKIEMDFDQESRLKQLRFAKSGFEIPVNSAATMEINFRGGSHSFPYVSAMEMMNDEPTLQDEGNGRKLASVAKTDVLKDAYVFIGVTALGTNDMRAFPMDPNVPGVEGHANILDNLLGKDMLIPSYRTHSTLLLMLMIFGALAFSFAVQRLDAIPALLVFVAAFGGFGFADFKILFGQNISANSSFFYLEILSIFFVTVAVKYVIEERSKKFVRGAFAKYVAPAVVDSILKNPEKLQVGGEKRDLTIMFSDIRSFTTFSERLDAKALAAFLNDYLGIMTKIVFAHEGTLDKYIGDAIMAFWGAPLDQPLHAANACKASMAMMKALHENKDRWKKEFNVDVSIGVGINSGPVNVGNMGSSDNFSYTVIGDHVNLSSRLEGLTKAYGVAILTTRFTFDDIGKSGGVIPPHRVLDNVKVKGKKNAVELIQVLDRELSKEGLEIFETARKLYEAQKWDEATALFKKAAPLLAFAPDQPDAPCDMYVERCEEFKKNPPGQDWDGSWEMHSK